MLLDEVLGIACGYDDDYDHDNEREDHDEKITMTAYLNVGFKKPVKTPGVVLCRAWVERREGRKNRKGRSCWTWMGTGSGRRCGK